MGSICRLVCFPGTTDSPTELTHNPAPTENEVQFILSEIRNYLSPDISGGFTYLVGSLVFYLHVIAACSVYMHAIMFGISW